MTRKRVLLILAALVLTIAGVAYLPGILAFLEVDRCLDSGGMWDAESNSCLH
jgi:hypothetical protein